MPSLISQVKAKRGLIALSTLSLLVLSSIPSYYFYIKYRDAQQLLKNPADLVKKETQKLVVEVNKIIELPKGEDPTVLVVSDKSKLQNNKFFENSSDGDKLLVYPNAKIAYLYRPSAKKIIAVMPVNIGNGQKDKDGTVAGASDVTGKTKLALYNGSDIAGLTYKIEETLKGKISDIEIILRDTAKKNDYKKSLVINLSNKSNKTSSQIAAIAQALGAEVADLPEGEIKPDADILIIVAK